VFVKRYTRENATLPGFRVVLWLLLGIFRLVGDSAFLLTGANCWRVSKNYGTSDLGLLTSPVLPHHFLMCISWCSTTRVRIWLLTVLPHTSRVLRCSTANSVHMHVLTVLPHITVMFYDVAQQTACIYVYWQCWHTLLSCFTMEHGKQRAYTCTNSVAMLHFLVSRCSMALSLYISMTVLPHHFYFSRRRMVHNVHISVLTVLPHQFRFSLCTTTHSVHIHKLIVLPHTGFKCQGTVAHSLHLLTRMVHMYILRTVLRIYGIFW
jgi:hypothetical protein